MVKTRKTVGNARAPAANSTAHRLFAAKSATALGASDASQGAGGKPDVLKKNTIGKKLRQKLKHDSFVQKIAKAKAKSKSKAKKVKKATGNAVLNFKDVRSALRDIADELDDMDTSAPAAAPGNPYFNPAKVQSKGQRKRTKKSEMERFQAVVNFSAFKDNPLRAVQTHLANTLGAQPQS